MTNKITKKQFLEYLVDISFTEINDLCSELKEGIEDLMFAESLEDFSSVNNFDLSFVLIDIAATELKKELKNNVDDGVKTVQSREIKEIKKIKTHLDNIGDDGFIFARCEDKKGHLIGNFSENQAYEHILHLFEQRPNLKNIVRNFLKENEQ